MEKWNSNFHDLCVEISMWSTCLSRQVGAVIVRDKTIVSTGFNGPPRGIPHCGEERVLVDPTIKYMLPEKRHLCPRKALGFKSGQGLDLCTASHAEENAIVNAARIGVPTIGTTMYMSCGIPCKDCLKKIINAGIIEIVCTDIDDWYDDMSKFLVQQSKLKVRNYMNEENPDEN